MFRNKSDVRAGYQAAVVLIAHSSSETWGRFSAAIVTHSIFLAGIVLSFQREGLEIIILILGSGGLVFSFLSWLMLERGFKYVNHYISSAIKLENSLDKNVRTLKAGCDLFQGAFSLPGRIVARLVVLLFASIYAGLIGLQVFTLVCER